jgi:hypothetical protein
LTRRPSNAPPNPQRPAPTRRKNELMELFINSHL